MSSIGPTGSHHHHSEALTPDQQLLKDMESDSSVLLPGDVHSSNRSEPNAFYTSGGWEADLLNIVNNQGNLNTLPTVDLSPFLALIEQSSGGTAKTDDLENDFKSFMQSEEQKSQSSGSDMSSSTFDTDLQSFLGSEEQKYQPPGKDS